MSEDQQPPNLNRRRALGALGAIGIFGGTLLTGCGASTETDSESDDATSDDDSDNTVIAGECVLIPEETAGPFPLTAVLSNSAMVRQDITEGKTGVPLTLKLAIVDINNGCEPITSASVYVWHCDKDGDYSGYSQMGTLGETFCRGIQDVDSDGVATFNTVFPGWYSGRITHIHFQVFLYSESVATATSQLAFPQEITKAVYNTALYTNGQNTSITSFSSDGIFSDGVTYQLAVVTGDTESGYTATLQVGIAG